MSKPGHADVLCPSCKTWQTLGTDAGLIQGPWACARGIAPPGVNVRLEFECVGSSCLLPLVATWTSWSADARTEAQVAIDETRMPAYRAAATPLPETGGQA